MKDRLEIKLEIEFTASFFSGTGFGSGLIDRGIRRNRDGLLYIPASTFKGVLRNKVEEFIQIFYPPDESRVIYLSPNDSANTDFMTCYFADPLPVENLFGSNVKPGQLYFSDLEMVTEDRDFLKKPETFQSFDRSLQVEQRTQTRIYRSLKTVAAGALFKSEYGVKGLRFSSTIDGYLPGNPAKVDGDTLFISQELFFLAGGLKLIDKLAGNKSIGMGALVFDKIDVRLNDRLININTEIFSDENFNRIMQLKEG